MELLHKNIIFHLDELLHVKAVINEVRVLVFIFSWSTCLGDHDWDPVAISACMIFGIVFGNKTKILAIAWIVFVLKVGCFFVFCLAAIWSAVTQKAECKSITQLSASGLASWVDNCHHQPRQEKHYCVLLPFSRSLFWWFFFSPFIVYWQSLEHKPAFVFCPICRVYRYISNCIGNHWNTNLHLFSAQYAEYIGTFQIRHSLVKWILIFNVRSGVNVINFSGRTSSTLSVEILIKRNTICVQVLVKLLKIIIEQSGKTCSNINTRVHNLLIRLVLVDFMWCHQKLPVGHFPSTRDKR